MTQAQPKSSTGPTPPKPSPSPSPSEAIEIRIADTGDALLKGFSRVLESVPGSDSGPQRLAGKLGVDKVLASRLLKALRSPDPMAVVHRAPGPDPLRRVLQGSAKLGVPKQLLADAHAAVDQFELLIRTDIGDRGALEAIISAWVPEARREFELRRKQAAFRAVSHLKGAEVDVYAESVFMWPNPDGETIDVVWVKAQIGLRRLRPGATIKFVSRRQVEPGSGERRPETLDGKRVSAADSTHLPEFCSDPQPRLEIIHAGECVHTMLADHGFGAASSVNLVTCEVNRGELPRWIPEQRNRVAWVSSDVTTPAKRQHLDAFIHRDLFTRGEPSLRLYDTVVNGIADLNDPTRDIDKLDLMEQIEPLGYGISRCRAANIPNYSKMLSHICDRLGWDGSLLRCYRVNVEYPVHGMQTAIAFPTVSRPEA